MNWLKKLISSPKKDDVTANEKGSPAITSSDTRIEDRTVSPIQVKKIVLVTTSDQPEPQGFPNESSFVYSLWIASNVDFADKKETLTGLDLILFKAPDSKPSELMEIVTICAGQLSDQLPRIFVQFGSDATYPAGKGGPRDYALITFCEGAASQESQLSILSDCGLIPA